MIFYFSGTGNSLWAAKNIAVSQKENLYSIANEIKNNRFEYRLKDDEKLGFVFPIYSWGAPTIVTEFIERLILHNYKNNYVFAVCTCEANAGLTMKELGRQLKLKGLSLNSSFSLVTPSNYNAIFETKSKKSIDSILDEAEITLNQVNNYIDKKRNISKVTLGSFPNVKSKVIQPLFIKHAIKPSKFHSDSNCIACGLCEKVCPTENIKVTSKPVWSNHCTQCLACINRCPKKAIHYGKSTKTKKLYYNPRVNK